MTERAKGYFVLIFCTVVICVGFWNHALRPEAYKFELGTDFRLYYYTAGGDVTPIADTKDLLWKFTYTPVAKLFFVPWTWLPYKIAYGIWTATMIACYYFILYKLTQVRYGKSFALVLALPANMVLQAGNIAPALILVALYPFGAMVGCVFKPHCAVVGLVRHLDRVRTFRCIKSFFESIDFTGHIPLVNTNLTGDKGSAKKDLEDPSGGVDTRGRNQQPFNTLWDSADDLL